jgi:hypothetical protein
MMELSYLASNKTLKHSLFVVRAKGRDSSVGIKMGYGLGVSIRGRDKIFLFFTMWGSPSLLSNGYRGLFSRGKAAAAGS